HDPSRIDGDLDEVITGPERPELDEGALLLLRAQLVWMLGEPAPGGVAGVAVPLPQAGRDVVREAVEDQLERPLLQLVQAAIGLDGDHAAPDVHADGRGDDGALRGDHGPDRRADPEVRIGHEGDRTGQDREVAGLDRLVDRDLIDVGGPRAEVGSELLHYVPSLLCSGEHGGRWLSRRVRESIRWSAIRPPEEVLSYSTMACGRMFSSKRRIAPVPGRAGARAGTPVWRAP